MKNYSNITQRTFDEEDAVYFRNLYQSQFYIEHGCTVLDIFFDSSNQIVFVFPKKEHKKLIELWVQKLEEYKKEESKKLDKKNQKVKW